MTNPDLATTLIPAAVQHRLRDLRMRLQIPMVRRLILERAFTETERQQAESECIAKIEAEHERLRAEGKRITPRRRQQIESDQRARIDFVHFWSRSRNASTSRAIVDISLDVDLISPGEHQSLLRDIGELDGPPSSDIPVWIRETGKLLYRGKLVRKVSGVKRAKNLVAVLDEFERQRWPEWIVNPLAGKDDQSLREVVADLNRGLLALVFRTSGSRVLWEVKSAAHRPRDGLRRSRQPR